MKLFQKTLAVASLVLLAPVSAMAYTFDFSNDPLNGADVVGERGVQDGTVLEFGGLFLRFAASAQAPDPGYAYFDSISGGKPAGLGVCGVLDTNNQCNPSSDDNLTQGENLRIAFFEDAAATQAVALKIDSIVFRDADHNIITDTNATFALDGFVQDMVNFSTITAKDVYRFSHTNAQYYLQTITASKIVDTPVAASAPASWMIVMAGMFQLLFARRSRLSAALRKHLAAII